MLSLEVYDVVLSGIFFFSKNSVKSVFLTIKSCCGAERANCDVVVLFCRVKTIFALFIESFSWFLYMSLIGRTASVNIAAGDLMNVQSVFEKWCEVLVVKAVALYDFFCGRNAFDAYFSFVFDFVSEEYGDS